MTIEEIKALELELATSKQKLVDEYKALPKAKPLLEFRLVFEDSPIFALQMRCLNLEALKEQQNKDFANTGSSSCIISNYRENWSHQMSYVLTEHNDQFYLVYVSGGNIHTRTDKEMFGYTLKLTKLEHAEIKAQRLPKSILSAKDYFDLA